MMPEATTQKTARQVLGEALRFYREQRGLTPARVADMTKASRGAVDDWEAGRVVPNSAQWELLKKMVHHGLSQMSAVRQRALAEADAERALVQRSMQRHKPEAPAPNKPLTTRPFAEALTKPPTLKIVPPEPAPTVTTPTGVPSTLLGDNFDLTDAYLEVKKLPPGWGTAEAKEARYIHAKDLIKQGQDTEAVVKAVREKFNVGISRVTIKTIHTELEREAKREAAKAARAAAEVAAPAPPVAAFAPSSEADRAEHARELLRKSPFMKIGDLVKELQRKFGVSLQSQQLYALRAEVRENRPTRPTEPMINEKDIEAAAQLVLGAIPNLRTFTISVDDSGEVTVNHTTREVRVVEASGSIKLKR